MATKIKRCLYIGLGGTGMTSLLHTKRMFIDTYGKVPPMIGFLGFDTDGGAYSKTIKNKHGEEVKLLPSEQLHIKVEDPRNLYARYKEHFSWVPEKNVSALTSMTRGAGQIRTNGRFAFTMNEDAIESKLQQAMGKITDAKIMEQADKYQLLGHDVEIHMVFSVSGGTGSGTFINMAYLCRKLFPEAKIVGYGVLADVFTAQLHAGVTKVKPNAYGAVCDLDYLMHFDGNSDEIEFDYLKHVDRMNMKPFNAVFLINNKNEKGDTYDHVDQLAEMISLALVTSSGELASASASTIDNLEKDINEKSMDVDDKRAWVSGLGVSEIIFSGKELSGIYTKKAALRYIKELRNGKEDGINVANAWINEVEIRENQSHDYLIDYLLDRNPGSELSEINDDDTPESQCNDYIQNRSGNEQEIKERLQKKSDEVKGSLHALVVKHLNRDGGVGDVREILKAIKDEVNVFLDEMTQEKAEHQAGEESLTNDMENAIGAVKDAAGSWLKKAFGKGNIREKKDELMAAVNDLVIAKREIRRRDNAIIFYNNLLAWIDEEMNVVEDIDKKLETIKDRLSQQVHKEQNNVGNRSRTFLIDLSAVVATDIQVGDSDVHVGEFVGSLATPNLLYDYAQRTGDELMEQLLNYTAKLPGAQAYENTTVDDVINKMGIDELNNKIDLALAKSEVLLRQDTGVKLNPADCYYIGVANKERSRLNKDNMMRERAGDHVGNFEFVNTGMSERVIVYHQYGVIPAFAVKAVPTYKDEYDRVSEQIDCHFDYNMEQAMKRKGYSLFPHKKKDDSLELWVKGFIFGVIKREKKADGKEIIKIKSKEKGDVLYDYWLELSEYRDFAFDAFRKDIAVYRKDIENAIDQMRSSQGENEYQKSLAEARENYREQYVGLSNEVLEDHGKEKVRDLVRKELEFVATQLA